jgi:hypothetical protein
MTVPMKWSNNIFCTSRFKINVTVKWYKLWNDQTIDAS